jgi:oxygen-independent coproporphyrinogen-3 oxidase
VHAAERFPVLQRSTEELHRFLQAAQPPSIASIYIGGGTPNILSLSELQLLCGAVSEAVQDISGGMNRRRSSPDTPASPDWTVEVNPECLTPEQLDCMADYGVSRLSMGVQSFDRNALLLLDRSADPDDVERSLEHLRKRWRGELSLDLMVGIPGRTPEEELGDVQRALTIDPGHISVYALTLEEGTALAAAAASGRVKPQGEEQLSRTLRDVQQLCSSAGYRRYEVSNYARPGRESLHNLRYWRMRPYLGIGPSAVSTLPGEGGPLRLTGRKEGEGYDVERVAAPDFLLEHLMMGLRTAEGVSLPELDEIFGISLEKIIPRSIHRFQQEELLRRSGNRLQPAGDGMLLLDYILVNMAAELEQAGLPADRRPHWPLPRM